MTDIVERLRNSSEWAHCKHSMREEAADEIERLRDHMRALGNTSIVTGRAGIFQGMWQASEQECEQLRAEVEQLRVVLAFYADDLNYRGLPVDVLIDHGERARRVLEGK